MDESGKPRIPKLNYQQKSCLQIFDNPRDSRCKRRVFLQKSKQKTRASKLLPLFVWTRSPSFISPTNQISRFPRPVHFSFPLSVQCVSHRACLCRVLNNRHIVIRRKNSQAFPFLFPDFRMSLLTWLCNIHHIKKVATQVPVRGSHRTYI